MACLFIILLVTVLVDAVSSTVYCTFTKQSTYYSYYSAKHTLSTTYYTQSCSDYCSYTDNRCGYNSYTSTTGYKFYQYKSSSFSYIMLIMGLILAAFCIVLGVSIGIACYCGRAKEISRGQIILPVPPNTCMHEMHDISATPSHPLLAVIRTGEPRNDVASSRV